MSQKVSIIYFSPTGNTRKTLEVMAQAVGDQVEAMDMTCVDRGEGELRQFDEADLVIFGAPVYGGRIPAVAIERFSQLRGKNTPCLTVVTYGNRDYDDALLELSNIAKSQGFVVKGAAAVVGRHTYGEIQITRPDQNDFEQDRKFVARAFTKPDFGSDLTIPGNFPYQAAGAGGRFHPSTSSDCIKCGLCVKECPVQALQDDYVTITDSCISCFRCIRNCPVKAKNMMSEEYRVFSEMFTEKLKNRKENQYFV